MGIENARIVIDAKRDSLTRPKLTFAESAANDMTFVGGGPGMYAGFDNDIFKLRIGNYQGCPLGQNRIEWDGYSLAIYDANGNRIINAPSLVSGLSSNLSTIGGWTIGDNYLINSGLTAGQSPRDYPFWAGGTYANRSSAAFRVNALGVASCNSLLHNSVDLFNGNIINANILGSGVTNDYFLKGNGTWCSVSGAISFPKQNQSSVYLRGDNQWVQISGNISFASNDNKFLRHDGIWNYVDNIPSNLLVTGTICATADVISYYISSDIKLKKDIKFITNGMEVVQQLHPVSFKWNDLGPQPDKSDVGLIAQEVERLIPTAVVNRGDGYKAIHLEKCIPYLINAIKELKREIDVLRNSK